MKLPPSEKSLKYALAESLVNLQKACKIYQNQTNWEKKPFFAMALFLTGTCLMELHKYADALDHLKKSLKIYDKFLLNEHIYSKTTSIRCKIDKCLLKLG